MILNGARSGGSEGDSDKLCETDGLIFCSEGDALAGDGDAEEEGEADGDSLGEILTIVDGLAD
jgi:hypothetical protein